MGGLPWKAFAKLSSFQSYGTMVNLTLKHANNCNTIGQNWLLFGVGKGLSRFLRVCELTILAII